MKYNEGYISPEIVFPPHTVENNTRSERILRQSALRLGGQNRMICEALLSGRKLTQESTYAINGTEQRIYRLGARIYDLNAKIEPICGKIQTDDELNKPLTTYYLTIEQVVKLRSYLANSQPVDNSLPHR